MPRNRTDKPHATLYNGYEKVKRNKSKKNLAFNYK